MIKKTCLFVTLFITFFLSIRTAEAQVRFFVDSTLDITTRSQVSATLRHSAIQANFYVEDEYHAGLNTDEKTALQTRLSTIGDEFSALTYPRLREAFGSEWTPGIDNDARITILLTPMLKTEGGYTRTADESTAAEAGVSNEREMIYLNAAVFLTDSNGKIGGVIAHEFQHLINFHQKTKLRHVEEERWLNEGKSEYAVTVAGFNDTWSNSRLQENVQILRSNPGNALGVWENSPADYAASSLFLHYLADQYGKEFIKEISISSYAGSEAIERALARLGAPRTFSEVFSDWTVTLLLNQDAGSAGRYMYKNPLLRYDNLHIQPSITHTIFDDGNKIQLNSALQDLQPQWYRIIPTSLDKEAYGRKLVVTFSTYIPTDVIRIPVVVTSLSGNISVATAMVRNGKGEVVVPNFTKDISSVVIIPASHTQIKDFTAQGTYRIFSFTAAVGKKIHDGDLIRAAGRNEVYIVKNGYRRWIYSPAIMNMYGHLKWENIIEVTESELLQYADSSLVRKFDDPRVFEVSTAGRARWLNITSAQFEGSGRAWDAVFTINERELKWLSAGIR